MGTYPQGNSGCMMERIYIGTCMGALAEEPKQWAPIIFHPNRGAGLVCNCDAAMPIVQFTCSRDGRLPRVNLALKQCV
jgi:hypothetical protein